MAAATAAVLSITGDMIKSLVSMSKVIDEVEKGLAAFSSGGVVQPVRTVVPVNEHHGSVTQGLTEARISTPYIQFVSMVFFFLYRFLGLMPSYCHSMDALATKIVSFYPNNSSKGVVSHQAMVFLLEASTGTPLAVSWGMVYTYSILYTHIYVQ